MSLNKCKAQPTPCFTTLLIRAAHPAPPKPGGRSVRLTVPLRRDEMFEDEAQVEIIHVLRPQIIMQFSNKLTRSKAAVAHRFCFGGQSISWKGGSNVLLDRRYEM